MGLRSIAFIDLETTDLNPRKGEILEVAVAYEDGTYLEFKVKPEHIETASPEALKVNGYSEEAWVRAITQKEAAERISRAINDYVMAGQNVKFDISFLDALAQQTGVNIKTRYGLDVVTLAYEHLKPLGLRNLTLKSVCEFLRIPPEPEEHRALNGALTAKKVYFTLLRAGAFKRFIWALRARTPETNRHRLAVRLPLLLLALFGAAPMLASGTPEYIQAIVTAASGLASMLLLDLLLPFVTENHS